MSSSIDTYVTIADAAALCGRSTDTVKRRHAAGAFPGARPRPGDARKTLEIPVSDLVAAGLLDADRVPDGAPLEEVLPRSRAERDLQAARLELEVTKVKLAAVEKQLARLDTEIGKWQKIAEQLSKTAGQR